MAPSYKLTYFPSKALAEPMRFLMKYGGIEFEDDRFEREHWPNIKPNMPFGQVPILTVDGKQYHQSIAMTRFLARRVKLVGKDEWEDLEIDSVVDTINDLRAKMAQYSYEKDETIKKARYGPLMSETVPYYLERLDKIAQDNDGHLACKKLTWADMYFVGVLDYLNFMVHIDLTAKWANLQKVKSNVLSLPAIKEWVAVRPVTEA